MLHGGSHMTRILNLVDHLLADGQRKLAMGRTHEGVRILTRLTGLRSLPAPAAEEAQARLAEVHLRQRRFRRARRHLTAALLHNPDHAEHHYQMARACQADGRGDLLRAADHYRRALELQPDHVNALVQGGLLALKSSQSQQGLRDLRRALELAPDDPNVLGKCARGLTRAGRTDEARALLRAALFRNPRTPAFRKLWNLFQFQQLRRQQEEDRLGREAALPDKDGPRILPFIRLMPTETGPARATAGGPATLPGPHRPRLASRTSRPSIR
jgi:tetratricopeptide (TPR) repeat protein